MILETALEYEQSYVSADTENNSKERGDLHLMSIYSMCTYMQWNIYYY